jgi:hypothetical protein
MVKRILGRILRAAFSDLTDELTQQVDSVKTQLEQLRRLQAFDHVERLLAQSRYADPKRLHRHEASVYSQDGEDGIILEIFRRIGVRSRRFLEIGVGNGLENNTAFLLCQGWSGMWIDASERNIEQIRRHFRAPLTDGTLRLKAARVTAENVVALIRDAADDVDLFSIDIDRNTYHVWKALDAFQPRVAVVEYNASIPSSVEWTVEYDPERVWNGSTYFGASLKALERLGESLGYSLVGCDLVGVNAFFVRSELCGDAFSTPFTAENHYEPPRTYLWPKQGLHHRRRFSDRSE